VSVTNCKVTWDLTDIISCQNYVVAVDGQFELVYGTSCSSPVSGAIFTMINDARLAVGKGPIGFINPTVCSYTFALLQFMMYGVRSTLLVSRELSMISQKDQILAVVLKVTTPPLDGIQLLVLALLTSLNCSSTGWLFHRI
jgi:hypothetical protein